LSLLLRALRGEDTEVAPVWIMRQAGRHLPEYRALKERHDFWTLARTPELTAEVTLQPVRRYGMDGAILFSDIMTPLPPMGLDLDFRPGPVLAAPVRDRAAVDALRVPTQDEVAPFVADAIRLLRAELGDVPLIGFGGAPLTLATYAVEGSGSKEYATFRAFLRAEPDAAHALLDKLAETSIAYLRMQVEAGAQAIQLFDGPYGLYVKQGKVNASLPEGTTADTITLEQAGETIALTRKIGIETLAYFMIGSPTETRADILQTIRFALELNPDFTHITILCPFPGTEIYARGLREGVFPRDHWREFAANPAPGFSPPYWNEILSDRELQELLQLAYKKFYTRPSYLLKKTLQVRSLRELKTKFKAGMKIFRMKNR